MKYKLRRILIGMILGALSFTATAFAISQTVPKDVTYRNIQIVVDGVKVTPADANGNYAEPFMIDGTTYLPVRAIANAFGKDVSWDDATNTVSLSNQSVVGTYTLFQLTLNLNTDNTGHLTDGNQSVDFTWVQKNNELALIPIDQQLEPEILIIDGNQLISEEDALSFTKIKEDVTPQKNGTSATLQKDVTYRDIKIAIDNNQITPTDANGNPVEPFILDGTTYLPVRAVANALNKDVSWDGDTNTVYLGMQADPNDPKAVVTMKTVTVDKTDAKKPIVIIEMQKGGIIKAELYPDVAPITVENFISLIEQGFYDGLIFHRNIPGFVIQGGCPYGTGTGGPGYSIKGEFASNGVENDLSHTRGVLSMARAQDPNSAGSQFFIMHADATYLDGEYAAFGMVIEGMDVVDKIATSGM